VEGEGHPEGRKVKKRGDRFGKTKEVPSYVKRGL